MPTRVDDTHLEKVLFPEAGVTRLDLLACYVRVAPFLLPFPHDRPMTMHRFPDGV